MIRKIYFAIIVAFFGLTSVYAGKSIVVDLSTQTATAYESDIPVFSGQISTGTAKRPTPTGRFRVLEKDVDHVSTSWPKPSGGAKMHYMLRLTKYGIAMHLGFVPSYPASHGCIRLQNGFAQKMYSWAHVGLPVRVVGRAPTRVYRPSYINIAKPTQLSRKRRKLSALEVFSSSHKILGAASPSHEKQTYNKKKTYKKQIVRKKRYASVDRKRKKRPTGYKKSKTLDLLSSSPKIAEKVQVKQREKWKNLPKKTAPKVNPLKAMRA